MPFDINVYTTPQIMGILNVTPDSFSDGGRFAQTEKALFQAETMLKDGALIIDIGGESTRPGAPVVPVKEELARVIPIIKALKQRFDCIISLDTSKAEVMSEGLGCGVDIINDVFALSRPGAKEVLAQSDVPVCLMHMKGTPETMQVNPTYQSDIVSEIKTFFKSKLANCNNAGISSDRVWLDPGFGFGKTLNDNYELLRRLNEFNDLNCPILAGLSRKSMIGNLLNVETSDRMLGSVVGATLSLMNGAKVLRVHDVAETKQALTMYNAMVNGVGNE
jgi:dihydropteroate synthase